MKKNAVHLNGTYTAKVSGKIVRVRIDAESPYGGWDATNLGTRKKIRVKSAQRLRAEVGGTTPPAGQGNAPVANVARDEAKPPKAYDPNRCATSRCKGEPALTYLGKPLCQRCWDRHCAEEPASAMVTEGAVPLAEGLNTSPVAAANEASWERALPGPEDGVNEDDEHEDDKDEDAGNAPANTGDAGELDTEDMATKTKNKKSKVRKGVTKTTAARKPKVTADARTSPAKGARPTKSKAQRTTKAAPANGDGKAKRVSAIDAAAVILKDAGTPMRSREIIEAAASKGLWTSPAGKTPHATLDAAMRREINTKGKDARFTVEGRGLFGFNAKAGA